MRRFVYLMLLVIVVSASATCVSASTDCERWFVSYRRELAHSRQVQRIAAAKRRAKLYAQGKLAMVHPKPKLVPAVAKSPRMTPRQTLHRVDLACGVLPEEGTDGPLISEETPAPFQAERPFSSPVDLFPTTPGVLIASNVAPVLTGVSPESPTSGGPSPYLPGFGGGYAPSLPGKGATAPPTASTPSTPSTPNSPTTPATPVTPGTPTAPGTPTTPGTPSGPSTPSSPSTPGTPGTPVGPSTPVAPGTPIAPGTPSFPGTPGSPDTPPAPIVPEPSSYILVLTGVAGAAGAIRRRFKA